MFTPENKQYLVETSLRSLSRAYVKLREGIQHIRRARSQRGATYVPKVFDIQNAYKYSCRDFSPGCCLSCVNSACRSGQALPCPMMDPRCWQQPTEPRFGSVEPLGRSLSMFFFNSPNLRDHDDPNNHNIMCVFCCCYHHLRYGLLKNDTSHEA